MRNRLQNFSLPLLLVAAMVVLCLIAEWLDRQRYTAQQRDQLHTLVSQRSEQLQQRLQLLEQQALPVVNALHREPQISEANLRTLAARAVAADPLLLNMTVAEGLRVTLVEPMRDQEAVFGMQYNLRPEWMIGVRRAMDSRRPVWTGPHTLVQTGQPGLVSRTVVFDPAQPEQLLGVVSLAVDLQQLLQAVEVDPVAEGVRLAIRGQDALGELGEVFFGDPLLFYDADVLQPIHLTEGSWLMAGQIGQAAKYPSRRSIAWRASGLLLALSGLLLWIGHERRIKRGQLPLQRQLMIMLLLLLMPMLLLQGWLSWQMAQRSATDYETQLVTEVSARVLDRVAAFFDVSRRVVAFNVDQFRQGTLKIDEHEALLQSFTQQIRQQPLLTFLSVGTHLGDYMAGSRPPRGNDRGLRLLQADAEGGRHMHMYRVDAANRRGSLIGIGNKHFDARTRPWFRAGESSLGPHWYLPYRYAIDDPDGAYNAMGMGMAAPLLDTQERFVGVLTADMALIQLSRLLEEVTRSTGGVAVLTETNGYLLASSAMDPLYRLESNGDAERLRGSQSENSQVRAMMALVEGRGTAEGRQHLWFDGQDHVLGWHTYALPDGPRLLLAVSLPRSQLISPVGAQTADMLLMMLCLLLVSLMAARITSRRIAGPLATISTWARRLGAGDWQSSRVRIPDSRVLEVREMGEALQQMTYTLENHTTQLREQVASRTAELRKANLELARQSATDGLTGLANRRLFDSTLQDEWARARREKKPLGLLMLDIDHFKQFNDHYGHLAGDECLRRLAELLAGHARRPGDLAARYGGEEFALIVPGLLPEELAQLAEQIRAQLQSATIEHVGSAFGVVTVSIGCASQVPGSEEQPAKLIARADAALYAAKRAGRNRIAVDQGVAV